MVQNIMYIRMDDTYYNQLVVIHSTPSTVRIGTTDSLWMRLSDS